MNNCLDTAEKKGRAEGRVEGEAIRIQKEKLENSRNFKKVLGAIEIISQATGLSVEEIEKL